MRGQRVSMLSPGLAAFGAALPDFALAAVFLTAWRSPELLPEAFIGWCVLIILLEFFIVHSAGFTGFVLTGGWRPRRKLIAMAGLGAFYTLLVGGFALAAKSWWVLASFWGLMINRMLSGLFARGGDDERMVVMASWAASVFFYVLAVAVTAIAPVPPLGITPEVVAAQGFEMGGLWAEEPHRAVAAGFFYFLAVGLVELAMHRWMPESRG
jgi:hypothetical protein